MKRLIFFLIFLFLIITCPIYAQVTVTPSLTFSTPVQVGSQSTEYHTITVTNNSGSDITFIVEHCFNCSNNSGTSYGAFIESGIARVLRRDLFYNSNTCQQVHLETFSLANGANCSFRVYIVPDAIGAVTGNVTVEWVPKPTVALTSIVKTNGTTTVVASAPLSNIVVGNHVTIIGTNNDPFVDAIYGNGYRNYNDTRTISSVTDSQHFTLCNTDAGHCSSTYSGNNLVQQNGVGYVSDGYVQEYANIINVPVSGTGVAEPTFDATHPPALPVGINADYTGTVMDTTYVAPGACTSTPTTIGQLQAVMASPSCGMVVCLPSGTTYTGLVTLPNISSCSSTNYLISKDYHDNVAGIELPGTRAANNNTHKATLATPGTNWALNIASGAHHWRIVGIEGLTTGISTGSFGPFYISSPDPTNPGHDNVVDRSWVHLAEGSPYQITVGIQLDGQRVAVVDSYIENVRWGMDYNAIGICYGPGPIKVVNSYLEASGENFMIGGCAGPVDISVPFDVEFRNNRTAKRLSWQTEAIIKGQVKNLFELKKGIRVLLIGNILEYTWNALQDTAIIFNQGNQHGDDIGAGVQDVTLVYNIVRHVPNIFRTATVSISWPNVPLRRIYAKDNLAVDVTDTWVQGGAAPCSTQCGYNYFAAELPTSWRTGPVFKAAEVMFVHNTFPTQHHFINYDQVAGGGSQHLFVGNIMHEGINDDGAAGAGNATIDYYMASPIIQTNLMLGIVGDASAYSHAENFKGAAAKALWFEDAITYPTSLFTDATNCLGGTFNPAACALAVGNQYNAGGARQAVDGLAVGANISALVARTTCVISGVGCGLADAPSVLPASINFGDQAIGSSSGPSIVTFTNSTGSSITITSANLTTGTNYSRVDNCSGVLASNASCTVSVTFTPQAPAGTKTDTLTFITDDAYSPHTISLSGNATGTPPSAPVITTFTVNPTTFLQIGNSFTFTLATTGADFGCEEYVQTKGITVDVGPLSTCNGTFTFTPPGPFSLDFTSPYLVWVVANGSGGSTQSSTKTIYSTQMSAPSAAIF